jgi:uncharacterized protein YndB with AHSA1/START domain
MNDITLVRRINARPSIVFDALTTVEGISAWWGPDDLPIVRAQIDARINGAYRVRFRTADGREHESHGRIVELEPPRRLVMSYRYTVGGEPEEEGRTSRIAFDLVAEDDGTKLTFTHSGLASEISMRSHVGGWTGAFDKLVRKAAVGAAMIFAFAFSFGHARTVQAQTKAQTKAKAEATTTSYAKAAPIAQYLPTSAAEEIALARTAAPASISSKAEVLVLGRAGYEKAVSGTNGFVCMVERAWDAGFDDAGFWNPKIRGPNCFNATAVRTQLPQYLKRTAWILAGADKPTLISRTRAAFASHTFKAPEAGALSYMLSKNGYLGDDAGGPWLPHLMIFVAHGGASAWGAGAEGSPIIGSEGSDIEATVLLIPVRRWSDGTPAPAPVAQPHT